MTQTPNLVAERRAQIVAHANAIGIDESFLSILVDDFYARVRLDPTLGPIFNNKIGDNWDHHLEKIKLFWSSVALNSGKYSGTPVPKHIALKQAPHHVEEQHFTVWLSLFRKTLVDNTTCEEAVEYMMERAERIGASLQLAMFGLPELKARPASR
jgi:hemoglobin